MKINAIIIFFTALITFAGGVIGYLKASSLPSLLAGLIFGVSLFTASYLTYKKRYSAQIFALVLLGTLTFFFTYRYLSSHKFMPAGVMIIINGFAAALLLLNFKRATK